MQVQESSQGQREDNYDIEMAVTENMTKMKQNHHILITIGVVTVFDYLDKKHLEIGLHEVLLLSLLIFLSLFCFSLF